MNYRRYPFIMKRRFAIAMAFAVIGFACGSGHALAGVIGVSNQTSFGGGATYGTTFFSDIDVLTGDYLVVSHANNRNVNNHVITATLIGSTDTFTSLNSDPVGKAATAWIFYTPITSNGKFSLALDTSNATKNVAHSTSVWVLRASGAGESIAVADTATGGIASDATSLTLDFDFGSTTFTNGFGVASFAVSPNGSTITGHPADWNLDVIGTTPKRADYSLAGYSDATSDPTVTLLAASDVGGAGAVFYTVPEPSSFALLFLGIGSAVVLRVRRQRQEIPRTIG